MTHEDRIENSGGARLFVYGTLRKGFPSHALLQRLHARFVATAYLRGQLYDLGEYPGAVESTDDRDRIHGEVYWIPHSARAFRVLDKFEGFDPLRARFNLFERKRTRVTLAGGAETEAWIYCLHGSRRPGRRVPSGDYAKCRM